jgi:hypothetical protein
MPENYEDECWESEYSSPLHTKISRRVEGAILFTIVELEGSVSEFSREATEYEIAFYGIVTAQSVDK